MKTCSVEGCGEKHRAKGFCEKHYNTNYYKINKKDILERISKPENKKRIAEYNIKYNKAHKEELTEKRAKPENKKRLAEYRAEWKNGMTPDQYQKVLDSQGNKCAICGSCSSGRKDTTRFCIDHEHIGGYEKMFSSEKMRYFRGLLCDSCNRMLKEGYDDMKTFHKYRYYLQNPPAKELGLKYDHNELKKPSKLKKLRQTLIFKFGDKCQINPNHLPGKKVFSIDHDHTTKIIRGLLCHDCNFILGYAKDSTITIENAIKYLESYQERKTNVSY